MILNSIIMKNIRSFAYEEIEFLKGITLFEGDIGSGKSSILMAIEFALFGLGSQKAESLLAKKSDSGYVILEFTVDETKYEIRRALHRKNEKIGQDPKNSWMVIDGEKLPLSPSELKQKVLQILKFNEPNDPKAESRIFRYAVFTPQDAMKDVLEDSKKRLETVRKAFGIEEYSTAAVNAKELSDDIKYKMAMLKGRFGDIETLENENKIAQKAVTELDNDIKRIEDEKKEHKTAHTLSHSELNTLLEKDKKKSQIMIQIEAKKTRVNDAKREVKEADARHDKMTKDLDEKTLKFFELTKVEKPDTTKNVVELQEEIARFQKIASELASCNGKKSMINAEISNLEGKLSGTTSDLTSMKSTLTELQRQYDSHKDVLEKLKVERNNARDQKIQKQTEVSRLDEEIAKFSRLGSICPTCKQKIEEAHHHELVEGRKKKSDVLKYDVKTIEDSIAKTEENLEDVKKKAESCDMDMERIKNEIIIIGELEEKKPRLAKVLADISRLEQENADKRYGQDPIKTLSGIRDGLIHYEGISRQKDEITKSKKGIESSIEENKRLKEERLKLISEEEEELVKLQKSDEFEGLDEQIHKKRAQVEQLMSDVTKLEANLAQKKERRSNEESKIQKNMEMISEYKKLQDEFTKISECREWVISYFIPAIIEIERQVLLAILQDFNVTYRRWYSILVEDSTKESRIDEDFTPTISQDGYEQELKHLSGGEKTSIALAYRLTLNSLIRKETDLIKSNLLILDEPTDGFSKNQLGKIRELLDELKSEQVILVSHEKELEAYVENIFEITKQEGVSKVSRKPTSAA